MSRPIFSAAPFARLARAEARCAAIVVAAVKCVKSNKKAAPPPF